MPTLKAKLCARSANTIGPIAPKLCRPRDLARNLEDRKSERRASTLAPTTLPQNELQNSQLEQVSGEPTKIGGRRSGPAAPRPCRLTFHTFGEADCTFGRPPGPPDQLSVLGVWGSRAPPTPKPAVAEVVPRAPNNERGLSVQLGKQFTA